MTKVQVQAGTSILKGYVRTPRVGICELIWNASDEDAMLVEIEVEGNDLGGADQLVVRDDGNGMNRERAEVGFSRIGDSWKQPGKRTTTEGRPLHGRYGRGRFSAFSLGGLVRWESISDAVTGGREQVVVRGSTDDLQQFDVDSYTVDAATPRGTTVFISNVTPSAASLLDDTNDVSNTVLAEFAIHLRRFPSFKISVLGTELDVDRAVSQQVDIDISILDSKYGNAKLTVIEWDLERVERRLYLCDPEGTVVDERQPGVQAPGAEFTAYITWAGFDRDVFEPGLEGDEGNPVEAVVSQARDALRDYLKEAQRKKESETISRWKREGVYPYRKEPGTRIERASRDAFNMVAMAASRTVDEGRNQRSKALSLSLLKEAFEKDPEAILPILKQVTVLPTARISELQHLLSHTTLSQLIQLGSKVGERVDFVNGLNAILFEKLSKKQLLERRQLHRILAHETWIFGEEWALMGDDVRLTEVLKEFLTKLDPDVELANIEPVLREDGSDAIPDLVFGRKVPAQANELDHLVVELKRPSHRLIDDDVAQIRSYASAIVNDDRFDQANANWTFILVGNETSKSVDENRRQIDKPVGFIQQSRSYSLWVKTWAEIITEAEHRLKFVQESLSYESDRDAGVARLRDRYEQYLPDDPEQDVSPSEDRPAASEDTDRSESGGDATS